MTKTIVVCGHGPGISDAVALHFGRQGFNVALVARSADKLTTAASALVAAGINARPFPADLGDPAAVVQMIADVRATLGAITVVHYNAYAAGVAGDLLTADAAALRTSLDVSVVGLVTAVQAALPDLEASQGAVLVTGGGFAFYDSKIDAMATTYGAMGLALGKAAQHKATGLLAEALAPKGIYVGEVVVLGSVKGTAFDSGGATLEAPAIAQRFWELYSARTERIAQVG